MAGKDKGDSQCHWAETKTGDSSDRDNDSYSPDRDRQRQVTHQTETKTVTHQRQTKTVTHQRQRQSLTRQRELTHQAQTQTSDSPGTDTDR